VPQKEKVVKKILAGLSVLLLALFVLAQDRPATVVDIAAGNADFSTLVAAVQAAGLVETLQGEGPFTVFAPTNDAFAAALEQLGLTAEELLASEDLGGILTYHVVPGRLLAADVLAAVEAGGGATMVETVNGAPITVEVVDGNVVLNGTATVTMTDLEADNGVVHVIDGVILPPAE
jgi:transforming growth factor-beta-induced protein